MGGFCTVRTSCAHYHAADRRSPSERLCAAWHDAWQPITLAPEHLVEHHNLAIVRGVAAELQP
jgi:hypothetical protein